MLKGSRLARSFSFSEVLQIWVFYVKSSEFLAVGNYILQHYDPQQANNAYQIP